VKRDLDEYLLFRQECDGVQLDPDDVDFEEFMGYLDLQHFLGLRGKEQWSVSGNQGQLIVKGTIARILAERTPRSDKLPSIYYDFANELNPHDVVLTLNYDIILERALEAVQKPFRLSPERYLNTEGVLDTTTDEVIVLKLHGSVDWFDRTEYADQQESNQRWGFSEPPRDAVFGPDASIRTRPLLEGAYQPTHPLAQMHRVLNIDEFYANNPHPTPLGPTPWLLPPSTAKFLYTEKVRDFWWGLGQAGAYVLGIAIIGYSLPKHDDYVRQALFHLLRNYQRIWWDQDFPGNCRKFPVIMIDRQNGDEEARIYRKSYGFIDPSKTLYHLGGFDDNAMDLIRKHKNVTSSPGRTP